MFLLEVKIICRSYSRAQRRVDNIQSCIRESFQVYYLMMFTQAMNRSFSPLARGDFKVSQEHNHCWELSMLKFCLTKMLFGLNDYITYSIVSPSPLPCEFCAYNTKISSAGRWI